MKWLGVSAKIVCFCWVIHFGTQLFAQTIEEKMSGYHSRGEDEESYHLVNRRLSDLRQKLSNKHELVTNYCEQEAGEEGFKALLAEVNQLRNEIEQLEKKWRKKAVEDLKEEEEGYALWNEEETTLSQLIMEYGSRDYLYVIPPALLAKKIHLHSAVPVPRESWNELLEIILFHNGVGVKQINPFAKQLYLLKKGLAAVDQVLTRPEDLALVADQTRIAYVFSPPPERVKGIAQFFDKFRDQANSFIYQVGYKIAIVASKEEVKKLLTLHDAIWEKENGKVSEIISISKLTPLEMEKILNAYFKGKRKGIRIGRYKGEGDELELIPLKDQGSLVIIGPKEMVEQAKRIAHKAESQIEDPLEMTVFWYTCRHSDPIEVAEALEKVYDALVYSKVEGEPSLRKPPAPRSDPKAPLRRPEYGPPPYSPVNQPPSVVSSTLEDQKRSAKTTNFIPYPKTGSIMMVVRRDTLGKIKEMLRKIDIPKKMVRIEAVFFEKRIENENRFGLDVLAWGSEASHQRKTGFSYNQPSYGGGASAGKEGSKTGGKGQRLWQKGIVKFILQRAGGSFWNTFDIRYNFLLSQNNLRINAAPSTITLNQTAAEISIQEEISISMGAAPIDTSTGNVSFQDTFARSQFGITLVVTPTVHDPIPGTDSRYSVTLETSINFDTFSSDMKNNRPNVLRRKVTNFVRVADGETVILGGLRRKDASDSNNKLPFLGEIPGIGKLFGNSVMTDRETEMFIFITPRIIFDMDEDLERARYEQLIKRPGDLPEFFVRIEEAKRAQKRRLFDNSLKLMFGNIHE